MITNARSTAGIASSTSMMRITTGFLPAADQPCHEAEGHADRCSDRDGSRSGRQRDSAAIDDPSEEVSSELIGPEQMRERRTRELGRQILFECGIRLDQRDDHRQQHEKHRVRQGRKNSLDFAAARSAQRPAVPLSRSVVRYLSRTARGASRSKLLSPSLRTSRRSRRRTCRRR